MTSDASNWNRAIGESLLSDQSPCQTPEVNGCDGSASRAQANTFRVSFRASSGLCSGSSLP